MIIDPTLVEGGDCFSHYHSSDRTPSHDTIEQLQQKERVVVVASHAVLNADDDIVLVDTSYSNVTITLPRSADGKRYAVKKIATANTVTVQCNGSGTIDGAASKTLTAQWAVYNLKAVSTGYILL